MSSADLWEDNYPHGTPEGYDGGCKGGACPAGVAYGLSCKTAKSKSNGDVQYRRLVKAGSTLPEIADALGLIGSDPTAAPAAKALPKQAPTKTPEPKRPIPSPATVLGGITLADAASQLNKAAKVIADAGVSGNNVDETADAAMAIATNSQTAAPAPKPAEIRAWAIAKGYEVSAKGKLPQYIIEHYWQATGRMDPISSTAPADTEAPETDTAGAKAATENAQPVTDPSDVVVEISIDVPDLPTPTPPRPDWGAIAESVDAENARRWAVRLEQELAHVSEQFEHAKEQLESAIREADSLAKDVLQSFTEVQHLTERLTRRTEERDTAEKRARIAERAATLALTKWGQQRTDSEAAHALILGQAHTINRLTDELTDRPRLVSDQRYTLAAAATALTSSPPLPHPGAG